MATTESAVLLKDRVLSVSGGCADYAKYIEQTLEEAHAGAIRSAPEYKEGYWAGLSDGRDEARRGKMDRAAAAAYFYADQLVLLLRAVAGVAKSDIAQCRFGLDYATDEPAVLVILSSRLEDKMDEIMTLAAAFEVYVFRNPGHGVRDCDFWVITDHNLDQELIDNDFPYYREFNNAA